MYIYDIDSSCTHSDVLSDYYTCTYPLRTIWHIRPQHFLCQPLRFVPHFSSSIRLFPFLSLLSLSMLCLVYPVCVALLEFLESRLMQSYTHYLVLSSRCS